MNYERKQSMMTATEIQRDLDMIRLAYRERGDSLNTKRLTMDKIIGYSLLAIALGVPVIAAVIFKTLTN